VKAGELNVIGEEVRRQMVASETLKIPLVVDVGVGNSWEEAH